MGTYETVKNRILYLCGEKNMTIYKLAVESAIPHSTLKSILYGNSKNPGVVTLKMICDGLGISLTDFFNTPEFMNLEQELK